VRQRCRSRDVGRGSAGSARRRPVPEAQIALPRELAGAPSSIGLAGARTLGAAALRALDAMHGAKGARAEELREGHPRLDRARSLRPPPQ